MVNVLAVEEVEELEHHRLVCSLRRAFAQAFERFRREPDARLRGMRRAARCIREAAHVRKHRVGRRAHRAREVVCRGRRVGRGLHPREAYREKAVPVRHGMVVVVADLESASDGALLLRVRGIARVDLLDALPEKRRHDAVALAPARERREVVVGGESDGHPLEGHPEYVGLDEAPRARAPPAFVGDAPRLGLELFDPEPRRSVRDVAAPLGAQIRQIVLESRATHDGREPPFDAASPSRMATPGAGMRPRWSGPMFSR